MPDTLPDLNSEDKPYVTGGNAFEAYWRTLMTDCLAYPSWRLRQGDLKKYTEIFNEWRQKKTCQLPLSNSDSELGQYDQLDGDRDLWDEVGRKASEAGIYSLMSE
jgi:hypothetical protein